MPLLWKQSVFKEKQVITHVATFDTVNDKWLKQNFKKDILTTHYKKVIY